MATPFFGALSMTGGGATYQQPEVDSFGDLKKCVAKVVRGEGQAKYLEYAGDGILAGIDDINMRHLFDFASKRASTSTPLTLTGGTQAYPLAANFFAAREVQLVYSADNKPYRRVDFVPWEQFNELEQAQTSTGIPEFWTTRNTFLDDSTIGGQILFYPIPDATAQSTYKYKIEDYVRVDRPADDSDVISAPRELSDVLCTYGQYHLLFILDGKDSTRWGHKLALYRDKLDAFKMSRERVTRHAGTWLINYDRGPDSNTATDPLSD